MTHRLVGLLITLTLGSLVAPLGITALPPPKVPRVRFLYIPAPLSLRYEEAFRHGLQNSATWSVRILPLRSALL